MVTANEFKPGMVIRFNNILYQILTYQYMKMQQREPIVRTRMVNLKDGGTIEHPFRSSDKVEDVFVEKKEIQYLYEDGALLHFMNTSDYQDVVIGKEMIGDQIKYLKDNALLVGLYCDGELLTVELPPSVVLKVTSTEPGVRGDTAKAGTKPATLETGAVVKVPLFISADEMIKVDTRSGEYMERA